MVGWRNNSSGHRYDRNVTSVLSLVPETFWIEFPGTIAEMMGGADSIATWRTELEAKHGNASSPNARALMLNPSSLNSSPSVVTSPNQHGTTITYSIWLGARMKESGSETNSIPSIVESHPS